MHLLSQWRPRSAFSVSLLTWFSGSEPMAISLLSRAPRQRSIPDVPRRGRACIIQSILHLLQSPDTPQWRPGPAQRRPVPPQWCPVPPKKRSFSAVICPLSVACVCLLRGGSSPSVACRLSSSPGNISSLSADYTFFHSN